MPAFVIRGGADAGRKFVEALTLHSHVANIGDVRSLVIQPAVTTHSQLTAEEQVATGVEPGLVRLSVGLESIEDIIADLESGLRRRERLAGPTARPPLRPTHQGSPDAEETGSIVDAVTDALDRGLDAFARGDWTEAHRLLAAATILPFGRCPRVAGDCRLPRRRRAHQRPSVGARRRAADARR